MFDRILNAIRSELVEFADTPSGRELHKVHIERAFKDIKAALKFAEPYAHCPFGPDCTPETCKACRGSGWITKPVHDALPKEFQ